MRLIDADRLKEELEEYLRPGNIAFACDVFADLIDKQPTASIESKAEKMHEKIDALRVEQNIEPIKKSVTAVIVTNPDDYDVVRIADMRYILDHIKSIQSTVNELVDAVNELRGVKE